MTSIASRFKDWVSGASAGGLTAGDPNADFDVPVVQGGTTRRVRLGPTGIASALVYALSTRNATRDQSLATAVAAGLATRSATRDAAIASAAGAGLSIVLPEQFESLVVAGDWTAAIQAAVNLAASSVSGYYGETTGKVVLFSPYVYKITSPIVVPGNAGIVLLGAGKTRSTVYQATADTDVFQFSGNNFRGGVTGLRLAGPQGQVGGPSKAVNVSGSGNQIDVVDCWINTLGYGYYGNPTSDSNFVGNVVEFVCSPVYLAGSGNGYFRINGNTFYNAGPISMGASEARASFEFNATVSVDFSHNRFTFDAACSPQTGGYIKLTSISGFLMQGNVFRGDYLRARMISATAPTNLKVLDNIFPASYLNYLYMTSYPTNVEFRGNTCPDLFDTAVSTCAIQFDNATNIKVAANRIGRCGLVAVYADNSIAGVDIEDNVFDGGVTIATNSTVAIPNSGTGSGVKIARNRFKNSHANTTYDISVGSGVTNLVLVDNECEKGYSVNSAVGPAHVFGNIGGTTRAYLNAAPTAGTWKRGSKVWFEDASAAGNIGAVCVTGGAPGTWKTFGGIAA